ncbi:unnamed protein product, partial [Ectocarpus sp. 12 AP-2014]
FVRDLAVAGADCRFLPRSEAPPPPIIFVRRRKGRRRFGPTAPKHRGEARGRNEAHHTRAEGYGPQRQRGRR